MRYIITGPEGTIAKSFSRISPEYGFFDSTDFIEEKTFNVYPERKHEFDFRNIALLEQALKDDPEITHVFHLGAFVGTDYCDNYAGSVIDINVDATRKLVNFCNEHDLILVYFSTTAIFDPLDYTEIKPITEHTRIAPTTLYGLSKYMGEMLVRKFSNKFFVIRPVFGFSDYPEDLHSALTKAIYSLTNLSKLTILLDPNITKSYTRVENLVRYALNIVTNSNRNTCHNIGDNVKHNWYELFDLMPSDYNTRTKLITFVPEKDYLHYHHIEHNEYCETSPRDYVNLVEGINLTYNSIISKIS